MKNNNIMVGFKSVAVALAAFSLAAASALATPVKNIVLVHGAWVDGSGWRPVYDILVRDGYNVTMVQEPETSFQDDVTAAKRVLEFESRSQVLAATEVFTTPLTAAAWKTKLSWGVVALGDKIINPDLEKWYYARAHSHTTEIAGASHSVYESHPKEVAAVIEEAAREVSK